MVGTALGNRLDYAQATDDYLTARRQEKLSRRQLQPDLDLVAAHEQYDRESRVTDSLDLDRQLWTVGLAGQMNLLQHRDKTAVALAGVEVQAAREIIRIKALSITREVQQAASAYRQARTGLAIAGRNHEAAQARAELARRLFEMGQGDNFAATDAENAFIDAETQLLSSRSQVCVAGYRLLRAMGTLAETPEALKPKPVEPSL
jgi:outer membrane protein TolC